MKLLKELDRETFKVKFETKKMCYEYLAQQKWSEGYSCKKCSHTKYIKGKQPSSRRCCKCSYDESTTTDTLFHKLKFGVNKALEMLYEISTGKKGANSIWLAERFGIQQKTAWLFRQKIQLAMKSSEQYPLEEDVHVDEFEIGTPKEGKPGRSKSEKKMRVVIAFEERDGILLELTRVFSFHIANLILATVALLTLQSNVAYPHYHRTKKKRMYLIS